LPSLAYNYTYYGTVVKIDIISYYISTYLTARHQRFSTRDFKIGDTRHMLECTMVTSRGEYTYLNEKKPYDKKCLFIFSSIVALLYSCDRRVQTKTDYGLYFTTYIDKTPYLGAYYGFGTHTVCLGPMIRQVDRAQSTKSRSDLIL